MNQPSSSISSSEAAGLKSLGILRRGWPTLAWTVLWLLMIDLVLGIAFQYPEDPKAMSPNPMALYFDYGRSMEGRLRRATRDDPEETAPITLAGWYDPLEDVIRPSLPGADEVTIYGMSHAVRLADAIPHVSPNFRIRSVAAPGASTNWSYGAFLRDPDRRRSRAAVLAIMSSTLPMILSPTPMDWNTSFAMPYTADRFVLGDEGQLSRIAPPYESFTDYVRTLRDPEAWRQALAQFARTDPFYDPFLVEATRLDHSTTIRLVRRAWSQRRDRAWRADVLTSEGFDAASEPVLVANAIVADFAREARAQGIVPVVYIVDSFGYGDQLTRALIVTLRRNRIPFVSSSQHVDPKMPTNYLPDSHFTDANDRILASALAQVLDDELASGAANRSSPEVPDKSK